jgi:hypothetical protein
LGVGWAGRDAWCARGGDLDTAFARAAGQDVWGARATSGLARATGLGPRQLAPNNCRFGQGWISSRAIHRLRCHAGGMGTKQVGDASAYRPCSGGYWDGPGQRYWHPPIRLFLDVALAPNGGISRCPGEGVAASPNDDRTADDDRPAACYEGCDQPCIHPALHPPNLAPACPRSQPT